MSIKKFFPEKGGGITGRKQREGGSIEYYLALAQPRISDHQDMGVPSHRNPIFVHQILLAAPKKGQNKARLCLGEKNKR